jgi:hypothetical protein
MFTRSGRRTAKDNSVPAYRRAEEDEKKKKKNKTLPTRTTERF